MFQKLVHPTVHLKKLHFTQQCNAMQCSKAMMMARNHWRGNLIKIMFSSCGPMGFLISVLIILWWGSSFYGARIAEKSPIKKPLNSLGMTIVPVLKLNFFHKTHGELQVVCISKGKYHSSAQNWAILVVPPKMLYSADFDFFKGLPSLLVFFSHCMMMYQKSKSTQTAEKITSFYLFLLVCLRKMGTTPFLQLAELFHVPHPPSWLSFHQKCFHASSRSERGRENHFYFPAFSSVRGRAHILTLPRSASCSKSAYVPSMTSKIFWQGQQLACFLMYTQKNYHARQMARIKVTHYFFLLSFPAFIL